LVIRSERFDDIYFSPENGLQETHHVFLEGNNLPDAWADTDCFSIIETGFGTGLNFLCTWRLFDATAKKDQVLDFISFEKYPLSEEQIRQALLVWEPDLKVFLDRLLENYPLRTPGFHQILLSEKVRLTLVFDDMNEAIDELVVPRGVNCWFLDGFAPSKNPDMWSEKLFYNMAKLSSTNASVSTFTVAGVVKKGLQENGFEIAKKAGFGKKREMLTAIFKGGGVRREESLKVNKVGIIGGGLAGTSCAYILKQQGISSVIYDKSECLASGASGNSVGLFNPRFSSYRTAEADYFTAGYSRLVRELKNIPDSIYSQCGSLHLLNNEKKEKRIHLALENWGWPNEYMKLMDANMSSDVAGIKLESDCLYLPQAGFLSPVNLCEYYAKDVELRLGVDVSDLSVIKEDIVILCCGYEAAKFFDLPIKKVRGQISFLKKSSVTQKINTNLCYGGYITPEYNGEHILGSTFEHWIDHDNVLEEGHMKNIENLEKAIPVFKQDINVIGGRASFRSVSKDHFPIVGNVEDSNVLISLAHGSHGVISTITSACLLADIIQGRPYSLPRKTINKLSTRRFYKSA
jgi:tRNA 5-methylaminomethyl-2-thiouridine biosynthesis bifunctional protein